MKKTTKTKRVTLTPLPKLIEKTQTVFNAWIRNRDEGKPCISCGSYKANQAGHWISVRQSSFLRFDPMNVHLQCAGCNCYRYGNPIPYRIELRKRIGDYELERLERALIDHPTYKWSREELQEIIEKYSL